METARVAGTTPPVARCAHAATPSSYDPEMRVRDDPASPMTIDDDFADAYPHGVVDLHGARCPEGDVFDDAASGTDTNTASHRVSLVGLRLACECSRRGTGPYVPSLVTTERQAGQASIN